MKRRSIKYNGLVSFPVTNKAYSNTKEGGMFVTLVVMTPKKGSYGLCCGAGNSTYQILNENLLNDDKNYLWINNRHVKTQKQFEQLYKEECKRDAKYFPNKQEGLTHYGLENYISVPLVSSILLGSTGWSGWSKEKKQYWYCRYKDLTRDGKSLYNSLKKLYKGCELRLLTYLDT